MEMTKKEEKKSDWYWEIGNKKTNNPNEVIAWLIVEKAKLEEENKKLKEENEIIMRNADGIAHHNVELMKKVKELEKKLGIE